MRPAFTPLIALAIESIGTIRGRGFFTALAEELAAKFAVVGLELFDLCLEYAFAFEAASVLSFPVSGLLSQFEVFAVQ
jgi:hypothetical protein